MGVFIDLLNSAKAEFCKPCREHPKGIGCELPDPLTTDLYICCGPCSPFSEMRTGRAKTNVRNHPHFSTTFGDQGSVISMAEAILPHRMLMESVLGFSKALSPKELTTGMDLMVSRISNIKRDSDIVHFAGVGSFELDCINITFMKRPRLVP